jgi:flagellar protein FliT
MHRMPSQIEIYEAMSELSSRMVDAARANEWDYLVELERSVTALRDTLITAAADDTLTAGSVARKRGLIQQILEDDAEVRRHTEPWMEHVRQFLGDGARRRDVVKAYAVGAGESSTSSYGA